MATSNLVNIESFVELVRQRTPLYDCRHPLHTNRPHIANMWIDIAEQMQETEMWCRLKWSNLRSNFCRELRRRRSDKVGPGYRPWVWYNTLEFLLPFIENNKSHTWRADHLKKMDFYSKKSLRRYASKKLPSQAEVAMPEDSMTEEEKLLQIKMEAESSIDDIEAGPFYSEEMMVDVDPQVKDAESISLVEDFSDTDKSFLLSMLPMMKNLSFQDNAQFRIEVQQLLYDKLFPKDANDEETKE